VFLEPSAGPRDVECTPHNLRTPAVLTRPGGHYREPRGDRLLPLWERKEDSMHILLDPTNAKHIAAIQAAFPEHTVSMGAFTCTNGRDEYAAASLLIDVTSKIRKLNEH